MKFHIYWGDRLIASFENNRHRDDVLKYWQERFAYAADEITAKDD